MLAGGILFDAQVKIIWMIHPPPFGAIRLSALQAGSCLLLPVDQGNQRLTPVRLVVEVNTASDALEFMQVKEDFAVRSKSDDCIPNHTDHAISISITRLV